MTPKDWIAPGVIVAIMTVWLILSGGRFASIDNQYADIAARLIELEAKLDRTVYTTSAAENQHGEIGRRITDLDAKLDRSINSISATETQHRDLAKQTAEIKAILDRHVSSSSTEGQYAEIAKRIAELGATFERATGNLSGRLDSAGQQQSVLTSLLGEMRVELNALKRQLESVAEKSEKISSEPDPQPPTTSPGD
jgi:chromosome segregation ATPase